MVAGSSDNRRREIGRNRAETSKGTHAEGEPVGAADGDSDVDGVDVGLRVERLSAVTVTVLTSDAPTGNRGSATFPTKTISPIAASLKELAKASRRAGVVNGHSTTSRIVVSSFPDV